MGELSRKLSVVDRLIVGVTTWGGTAVIVCLLFPSLSSLLASLDTLPLPHPLGNLRIGSIICGFILCMIVTAIPAMYRARCDMLRRDLNAIVCRD